MARAAADSAGLTYGLVMTSGTQAITSAHDLGRRFGKRWAVRGIHFSVATGELFGVVGPDGSGKTTLLQMVAAILDPSEGGCLTLGFDTRREAKRIAARLGYMTQAFTLYDRLSVDENLALAARLRGVPMQSAYPLRRQRLLDMAGLEDFADRPAGQLSGGMRKKLSLCTNLIHEPELLILDEPGLGVDPLSRRQLWQILDQFRERGVTTIVATSYMDEAERCDRVVLLGSGRPVAIDTPDNIRRTLDGRVFELMGLDTMKAAAALEQAHHPFAIQVLADRVRFQMPDGAAPPTSVEGAVPRLARATLEDVLSRSGAAQPQVVGRTIFEEPADSVTPPLEPGISTVGLSVDFGSFRAVDDVSLTVDRGQILALLGPNGAGKTTLIRALCGLIQVSSGVSTVAGGPVAGNPHALRQRIGYMSQRFSLYGDLTAAENLSFFASAYGLGGTEARERIAWGSARTGLDAQASTLAGRLSGAERQRLALACSILHRPAVLFLDEPTSGIDPPARYRFWWLIRSLAASGMAIVVTTHYLDEAVYCDRIALMHRGRLIASGTLNELRRDSALDDQASVESIFLAALARVQGEEAAA